MCGFYEKEDGSKIPMRHDSEAAVLAYILQRMLIDEGFLDSIGNQVPVKALVAKYKREEGEVNGDSDFSESTLTSFNPLVGNGKKCPECGANAMHRRDGCFSCDACNFIGICG